MQWHPPLQYNIPTKWALLWEVEREERERPEKPWRVQEEVKGKLSIQGKPLGLPIVSFMEGWVPMKGNKSWPWHSDCSGKPWLKTSRHYSCNGEALPLGYLASRKPRYYLQHHFYKGIRAIHLDCMPSEFLNLSVATNLSLASHISR